METGEAAETEPGAARQEPEELPAQPAPRVREVMSLPSIADDTRKERNVHGMDGRRSNGRGRIGFVSSK